MCSGYAFYTTNKYLYMFNELSKCNCCERHAKDRPTDLFKGWTCDWLNYTQETSCSCSCRHFMRFLARDYNSDNSEELQNAINGVKEILEKDYFKNENFVEDVSGNVSISETCLDCKITEDTM